VNFWLPIPAGAAAYVSLKVPRRAGLKAWRAAVSTLMARPAPEEHKEPEPEEHKEPEPEEHKEPEPEERKEPEPEEAPPTDS